MKATITTEQEGILQQTSLDSITDYLYNIAEIAQGGNDFIQKVACGLTDETNGLELTDQSILEDWYYRIFLEM